MAVLDTNVVSELMRKSPYPPVDAWAAGYAAEELYFSAVSEAELRYGVAIMPAGQRRDTLVSDIESMLLAAFDNRILPFDSEAALAYAEIAAARRRIGRPISQTRLPDRGYRADARHGGGDAERAGLRRHGRRRDRPVGRRLRGPAAVADRQEAR